MCERLRPLWTRMRTTPLQFFSSSASSRATPAVTPSERLTRYLLLLNLIFVSELANSRTFPSKPSHPALPQSLLTILHTQTHFANHIHFPPTVCFPVFITLHHTLLHSSTLWQPDAWLPVGFVWRLSRLGHNHAVLVHIQKLHEACLLL